MVDYVKPAQDGFPERTCATIMKEKTCEPVFVYLCAFLREGSDAAEKLLMAGLVRVFRHKQDDEQRSRNYDQLVAAEAQYDPWLYCFIT